MSENSKEIGGRAIVVGKMPATQAVKVQVALVNLCGEALFKAVSSNENDQEAAGAAALSALSSRLDSDKVIDIMNTVFTYTSFGGERYMHLDSTFADRVEDLWPCLFFALQVNFRSFFRGSLFSSLVQRAQKLSQSSPQTSTGTSPAQ